MPGIDGSHGRCNRTPYNASTGEAAAHVFSGSLDTMAIKGFSQQRWSNSGKNHVEWNLKHHIRDLQRISEARTRRIHRTHKEYQQYHAVLIG